MKPNLNESSCKFKNMYGSYIFKIISTTKYSLNMKAIFTVMNTT